VFDQLWDFFPKNRYGKIAATVRTMWIPVRTCPSIRQVSHSKFRRPDASFHGLDTLATYMEIACIKSTVRTTYPMVRSCEALIWKLCASKVRPSGRQGTIVQTRVNSRKNFCEIWRADRTAAHPDALCLLSKRRLHISSQTII
jgi:hypothetical protein